MSDPRPTPSTANELRLAHLISPGIPEALAAISFHSDGPVIRRRMAGGGLHPGSRWHVAVHEFVDVSHSGSREYCEVHTHTCDELNLLLSNERLVMRIILGDEEHLVEAPASIYIPAGTPHSANVVEGTGFFLAIVDSPDYESSFARESPAQDLARRPR